MELWKPERRRYGGGGAYYSSNNNSNNSFSNNRNRYGNRYPRPHNPRYQQYHHQNRGPRQPSRVVRRIAPPQHSPPRSESYHHHPSHHQRHHPPLPHHPHEYPPLPSVPAPLPPPPPPPPEKYLYYNHVVNEEATNAKAYKKAEQDMYDMLKGIAPVLPTKQPGEDEATVIANCLEEIKGRGIFDKFRRSCMVAAESMPCYENMSKRVVKTAQDFINTIGWREGQNRILREKMREKIVYSSYFDPGIEELIKSVINEDSMKVLVPRVEDVVYGYLNVPKPTPKVEEKQEDKNEVTTMESTAENQTESLPTPNLSTEQNLDEEPYSPCPSPPGESNHPIPTFHTAQFDSNKAHSGPVTPELQLIPILDVCSEADKAEIPLSQLELPLPSPSPPLLMSPIACDMENSTIVCNNYLPSQEMASDDEEEEEEEEESPAFEKFGETSPPRVNPEELMLLRKQFDLPSDVNSTGSACPLPGKPKTEIIVSVPDSTNSVEELNKLHTSTKSHHRKKSKSSKKKHHKEKKKHSHSHSHSQHSSSKKEKSGSKLRMAVDVPNVPVVVTPSDAQPSPSSNSTHESSASLYLESIPSLGKKFEFYQTFINPLVMDDDVSVSSIDMGDFEDTVTINDAGLTQRTADWLRTNGAHVTLAGQSSPRSWQAKWP